MPVFHSWEKRDEHGWREKGNRGQHFTACCRREAVKRATEARSRPTEVGEAGSCCADTTFPFPFPSVPKCSVYPSQQTGPLTEVLSTLCIPNWPLAKTAIQSGQLSINPLNWHIKPGCCRGASSNTPAHPDEGGREGGQGRGGEGSARNRELCRTPWPFPTQPTILSHSRGPPHGCPPPL